METGTNFYSEMPTPEAIKSFIAGLDSQDKSAAEAAQHRMDNYYNCVDDYSWGGICDQAADQSRGSRNWMRGELNRQLESGAQTQVFTSNVLCDLNGNIVSDKIVRGGYGECWLISENGNVRFVSIARKQATYEKKGFKVYAREIEVEYYFLCKEYKGSLISRGRVISDRIVEKFTDNPNGRIPTIAFFALQK